MSKLLSILYVEDDIGSQKVMRGLMEILPFPVHLTILDHSTDFIQRIEAVEPEPDLFLLDIHVTPHNGFEMLSALRSHERFACKMVVALTASVMNEEVKRLQNVGFDGVLAKPLKFHDFPHLISRILEGERLWAVTR